MRRLVTSAIAIAAIWTAAPAHAVDKEFARWRVQTQRLGACSAAKHESDAIRYIAAKMPEAEDIRLRNEMMDRQCMDQVASSPDMDMTGLALQGALAEALLSVHLKSGTLLKPAGIPPLTFQGLEDFPKTIRAADPETRDLLAAMRNTYVMGECIVRADVSKSHDLLVSQINSEAEDNAFGTVLPIVRTCLQKGQKILTDKAHLRAAIAVEYFRLLQAASAPASAPNAPEKQQ